MRECKNQVRNWSLATRFLHLGMVLTVSFQLLISLIMVTPDHEGGIFSRLAFEAHEVIGLSALTIVFLHWGWSLVNQLNGEPNHLFPWFGAARQKLLQEMKDVLKGKLPAGGNRGGLPGFIHGLGLLAVTGIAVTGGLLFVLFPETGKAGFVVEAIAELHEGLATLVWTYWLGHGGVAILHHVSGHKNLTEMFDFRHTRKLDREINALETDNKTINISQQSTN